MVLTTWRWYRYHFATLATRAYHVASNTRNTVNTLTTCRRYHLIADDGTAPTAIFTVGQPSDCSFLKLEEEQGSVETTIGYNADIPHRRALQSDCSSVVFCHDTDQGKDPPVALGFNSDAGKPPSQEKRSLLSGQSELSLAGRQPAAHPASGVSGTRISGPSHPQQQQALPLSTPSSNGKQFRCPMCRKAFKWKACLEGHIRVHTGEKPFQCPYCSRTFSDRSNAKRHMLTHIIRAK
ncbi:hypothetical protein HPB51_000752 [Rhipicephalus microplus]|uniref:C2H2-type domain-containing protein n=1 Tax=Rhipicephalus microplus TaxID=6941 RepID=A0A9J6E5C5_RHIMP|nr:hypothetical protein HPB51_000752 [Rhipicephalus microplus]